MTSPVSDSGDAQIAAPLQEVLDAFVVHLRDERGLSDHTVRAYANDVQSLLVHAQRLGV
ncbi:MAG: recombinase XerD, partial [Actinobacteria bacterium]|nr:recombinase XerD [Actinomycetota bacterium]